MEFDKMSWSFLLYEGQKLLHKYDDLGSRYSPLTWSGGGESRNIRSFVEKNDCVEFELLDGKW